MDALLLLLLTATAGVLAAVSGLASWLSRLRSIDHGPLTVVNPRTGQAATLPRDYSPAAVDALLALLD